MTITDNRMIRSQAAPTLWRFLPKQSSNSKAEQYFNADTSPTFADAIKPNQRNQEIEQTRTVNEFRSSCPILSQPNCRCDTLP